MVDRVQHTFINSVREYVPAPLRSKISLKAVAILGALGLVLICAYYLHKSRFTIKKTDDPQTKKSDEPKPEEIKKTLTVKEIRVEKFLELIKKQLSPTQYLGTAIDNGDCFYDALSKALKPFGIEASPKQMRLAIAKALEDSNTSSMIEKNISNNPFGIDTFENYKKYVQYTHEELAKLRQNDSKVPSAPFWGAVDREGIILCHLYNCNICILSAGFRESEILNDKSYNLLSNQKGKFKEGEDTSVLDSFIQEKLTKLYNDDSFYFIGDETYPKDVTYPKTCTLALYENHFVPVLTKSS